MQLPNIKEIPQEKNHQGLTRGKGLLEPWLAHMRANLANRLIRLDHREGRVLDIGCGSYPYFLSHTYFQEKFAIDQQSPPASFSNIQWHTVDINKELVLPFPDEYFSVVTMLAVVEHLNPANLAVIFQETRRILLPGGVIIITTPSSWSDGLLKLMARIKLVSMEEIQEHVYAYTLPLLGWYFGQAGFGMNKVRFGYFEFFLNMWATAEK